MGCWDGKGNALCHCGATGPDSVELLRAARWHHSKGTTIGGAQYEDIMCPACAHDTHRRVIVKSTIEQDDLPFDWDLFKEQPKSQGGYTR